MHPVKIQVDALAPFKLMTHFVVKGLVPINYGSFCFTAKFENPRAADELVNCVLK
jgi:hypothetical protein